MVDRNRHIVSLSKKRTTIVVFVEDATCVAEIKELDQKEFKLNFNILLFHKYMMNCDFSGVAGGVHERC